MNGCKFYAELYGISEVLAKRISNLIEFISEIDCVLTARPWVKNGYCRVYIDIESQNNRHPILIMDSMYYDADENDIFIKLHQYYTWTIRMSEIRTLGKSNFSGAKTRENIYKMGELFYGEKIHWD